MQFDDIFTYSHNKMIALSICRAADRDVLAPVIGLIESRNITLHLVDDEHSLKEQLQRMDEVYLNHPNIIRHHVTTDEEAATKAVSLVSRGTCNILMKGMVSTAALLKEVLKPSHSLTGGKQLSHVALFDLPNYHKAVLITDAAMNIAPDTEQLKEIIDNAVVFGQSLDMTQPKTALLSAVEKVNPKIPSSVTAEALIDHFRGNPSMSINGPLQYDLAVSKKAADIKGIDSKVAGDADILVAPHIDAGNILYKSLSISAGSRVAGNVVGAKVPIVLTSRSDSKEDKFNSVCLAIYSL